MLSSETTEKLKLVASELCEREGCYLYAIDVHGAAKHRVVRIFVDCDAAPVTVEQCANISQALSLRLDVEDLVPGGAYELEVSSPGLERVLREPRHYAKSIGNKVKLVLCAPLPGAEKYGVSMAGILKSTNEDSIFLQIKEVEIEIPYEQIKRAQTVFDFNEGKSARQR